MNIKLVNVSKKNMKKIVLNDINLEFESGKIHGIFGPHNCGKTLLLKIISGFTSVSSGSVLYNDKKCDDLSLCYIPLKFSMIFSFKSNLKNLKEVFPKFDLEYAHSLIEKFDLQSNRMDASASTGTLSLMRVIITLASNADILIFDDIINGLDVINRKVVYDEILLKYNKDKQTMFISSAYAQQVESLLNDFTIIYENKVVLNSKLESLDNTFVITGPNDKISKYESKDHLIKNKLNNLSELIVFNSNEKDFDDVEVRQASLVDIVISYGGESNE